MFLKYHIIKASSKGIHIFALVTDIADPMRLLKDMRTEGLTLKQNVLGRVFDPGDPNQVRTVYRKPECKREVESLRALLLEHAKRQSSLFLGCSTPTILLTVKCDPTLSQCRG